MTIDFNTLKGQNRLLFSIPLCPVQGQRFQPTGFPDLGAATYETEDGTCLLVESAQSMANRLETVCWDDASSDLVEDLRGLSYVKVLDAENPSRVLTSSVLDAHRLNSPYITEDRKKKGRGSENASPLFGTLQKELGAQEKGPIDRKLLASVLLRYDAGSLIHGVFLAKKELAGGRLRVSRALTAFIESEGVRVAASGGVKNDHVDPKGTALGDTKRVDEGFGNVPFHRDEYTAKKTTLYANVDLSQLRGYALGEGAERLLVTLALYKLRALVDQPMRLRTACDLKLAEPGAITAENVPAFALPDMAPLRGAVREAIAMVAKDGAFAGDNGITTVTF